MSSIAGSVMRTWCYQLISPAFGSKWNPLNWQPNRFVRAEKSFLHDRCFHSRYETAKQIILIVICLIKINWFDYYVYIRSIIVSFKHFRSLIVNCLVSHTRQVTNCFVPKTLRSKELCHTNAINCTWYCFRSVCIIFQANLWYQPKRVNGRPIMRSMIRPPQEFKNRVDHY